MEGEMTERDKQLELALIVCRALAGYRPWQDGARDRLSTIVEGAHRVLRMSEPPPSALPAPSFELFAAVVGAVPESDDE